MSGGLKGAAAHGASHPRLPKMPGRLLLFHLAVKLIPFSAPPVLSNTQPIKDLAGPGAKRFRVSRPVFQMALIFDVVAELALLTAALAFSFLVILLFRKPKRPKILRSEASNTWAAVGMATIIAISFGLMISGVIATGLPLSAAIGGSMIVAIAIPFVLWRLLRMRGWFCLGLASLSFFLP